MTKAETKATLARAAELISGGWTNEDGADAIGALEEVAPEGGLGDPIAAVFLAISERHPEAVLFYKGDEEAAIRAWNAWEISREEVVVMLHEAEALV